MKRMGFIGVGIMDKSIVRNLMEADHGVAIYTGTGSKMKDIIGEGAIWCGSTGEYVKRRRAVISTVEYPKDVEDIYFGEGGTIANTDPGTYLIDMTAASPRLAVWIYEEAKKTSPHALDAPVTRGDKGARNGTLTTLAGGNGEDFNACLNTPQVMGRNVGYGGKTGNGQYTKICNQTAVTGVLTGACEVTVCVKNVGPDVDAMLKSTSIGAADSVQMNNVVSRALQDGYRPGFFIKHFIKDMNLADEEARAADTELRVLEDVLSMYKELEQGGMGELGIQALIKYYNW